MTDGGAIVRQAVGLGFRCLEVEYRVSGEAVPGIAGAVRSGEIRVLSVHNYAPLMPGEAATSRGGDKHNLASLDAGERQKAVEMTLRSLDLGRRLGAEALVLHLGETDITREYFKDLVDVVESEGAAAKRAADLRRQVKEARDARKTSHLEAALRSLDELLPHAEKAKIVLGIENRYYFHQVPLAEEIPGILERTGSRFVRYWHDIGHAHVMEVLGFAGHQDILESLAGDVFGVHIHDAVFIKDHLAPGAGEIPLERVLRCVPRNSIKIVELSGRVPRGDIIKAMPLLEKLGLAL